MKISGRISVNHGEAFLRENHPKELEDIEKCIADIDILQALCKISEEKTRQRLILSPVALNEQINKKLHKYGWTASNPKCKKGYTEPRIYEHDIDDPLASKSGQMYRAMDGIKNYVGVEVQFGKYAFMAYDIFSKMPIFRNRNKIDCAIEIVAMPSMTKIMSTGVSSFRQIEFEIRERRAIKDKDHKEDVPVLVIGIEPNAQEMKQIRQKQLAFENGECEIQNTKSGSKPGPK